MSAIPSTRQAKVSKYQSVAGGQYPARLVRFIGLGIQEQPDFKDEKKDPAFKCAMQFELYDPATGKPMNAMETNEAGEIVDSGRPSCVFQDYYLFPNARRGKVFDMCVSLEPKLVKSPGDLGWFIDKLGSPLMVTVLNYPKKNGTQGAKVAAVQACPAMVANAMEPARSDLVGFDPYENTEEMKLAYAKMFNFQREIVSSALDGKLSGSPIEAIIPFAGTDPVKLDAANNKTEPTMTADAPIAPMADVDLGADCPF